MTFILQTAGAAKGAKRAKEKKEDVRKKVAIKAATQVADGGEEVEGQGRRPPYFGSDFRGAWPHIRGERNP